MAQGGLVDLVALGQQDVFTVGNPQITFFKSAYKRHTNFTQETVGYPLDGSVGFGKQGNAKIQRNGDLVKEIYLQVKLPQIVPTSGSKFAWVRKVGHAMINNITIEIGGTQIDKHYGVYMNIWYELARCAGKKEKGYAQMIGDVPELTEYNSEVKNSQYLYIPLIFWFNKNAGLAIPLIALQYHEVYIRVQFEEAKKLIVANKKFYDTDLQQVKLDSVDMLVNYVYLDSVERRRFAQVSHEYLIEQLQHSGSISANSKTLKTALTFNHPNKELIWALALANFTEGREFMCYTHEDKWGKCGDCNIFVECAKKVLQESIVLLNAPVIGPPLIAGEPAPTPGVWEDFLPTESLTTANGQIQVTNNSTNKTLWINTNSLSIGSYSITGKISATIVVSSSNVVTISNVGSTLTLRDLSIPVMRMTDTRYARDDPRVYQHHNFGVLLDGSQGPIESALIQFNGTDRFQKREGKYFNTVQPYQHHTNTPVDGIHVYSFALNPESYQPTGSANLSRIDNTFLNIDFFDPTAAVGLPDLGIFDNSNKFYVFGRNINILRIISGMGGVAYAS
jgi:hypothetical protein